MVEATASIDVEVRATSGGEDELMVLSKQRSDEEEEQLARTSIGLSLDKKLTLNNETSRPNTPPKNHLNPTKQGMVSAACNAAGGCGLLLAASRDVGINQVPELGGTSTVTDPTSITENSDLLNRSRTIWIVTTAALPWRTGTSVNPLWRAVYLAQDGHKVYLLIPWLADENSRKKLYGTKNYFPNGPTEQIDWIYQNFIGPDYQTKIEIRFWNGVYQESFGSIFPVEDICQLIPNDEADVAILEEPEHLNWFRIVQPRVNKNSVRKNLKNNTTANHINKMNDDGSNKATIVPSEKTDETADEQLVQTNNSIEETRSDDVTPYLYDCSGISASNISAILDPSLTVTPSAESTQISNDDIAIDEQNEINVLGWAFKFRYVIGILHTNYGDYIRQYGMLGTSFLGASALQALSTLVVRAYCHKVIRLSATLPSFWTVTHNPNYKYPSDTTMDGLADFMEGTENVHGVRSDFLNPPITSAAGMIRPMETDEYVEPAPVYFIGKLIWAKGFEQVLELEELYKSLTNEYFNIDVYGSGNDEKAIKRAFLGRNGISRGPSNVSSPDSNASFDNSSRPTSPDPFGSEPSKNANLSLRSLVDELLFLNETTNTPLLSPSTSTDSPPNEIVDEGAIEQSRSSLNEYEVQTKSDGTDAIPIRTTKMNNKSTVDPLNILGDLTQKTVGTGAETAEAALKMMESIMQTGFGAFFGSADKNKSKAASQGDIPTETIVPGNESVSDDSGLKSNMTATVTPKSQMVAGQGIPFHLAPARARFKWRRHPIPSRFLGVQDHIVVRDIPEHKVFLNMSTSEVLCTTSAEALAMSKFVILPRHPSNDFFTQFPNCLAYESLEDCATKIQYALANTPEPLNEKFRRILSWEGATERLYKSVAITKQEEDLRARRKVSEISMKAARFHVEASKKSHFVGGLFSGGTKMLRVTSSPLMALEEKAVKAV